MRLENVELEWIPPALEPGETREWLRIAAEALGGLVGSVRITFIRVGSNWRMSDLTWGEATRTSLKISSGEQEKVLCEAVLSALSEAGKPVMRGEGNDAAE